MGAFRSSILDLPPEIRKELEELIDKDASGLSIYGSLKTKYSGMVQVPTVPTILRYMRYYKMQKLNTQKQIVEEKLVQQFEDGIQEIERLVAQVNRNEDTKFNKLKLLEGLAGKCLVRINELEHSTVGGRVNTSTEAAIVRYISETKSIVESITKLASTTQEDEKVLIQVIRNESMGFLQVVKEVVLEVCPEKYEDFKRVLNQKLQNKNIEIGKTVDAQVVPPQGHLQEPEVELPIPAPQIPESVLKPVDQCPKI